MSKGHTSKSSLSISKILMDLAKESKMFTYFVTILKHLGTVEVKSIVMG